MVTIFKIKKNKLNVIGIFFILFCSKFDCFQCNLEVSDFLVTFKLTDSSFSDTLIKDDVKSN